MDELGRLFKQMARYPVLPQSEMRELLQRKNTDPRARERLYLHNFGLVVSIAKRYRSKGWRKGLSFMELIQEGAIGLGLAIDKFDVSRGTRFSTYATWWIRHEILRSTNEWNLIHIPVNKVMLLERVRTAVRIVGGRTARPVIQAEIAEELGISVNELNKLSGIRPMLRELDAVIPGYDDRTYAETISAPEEETEWDRLEAEFNRARLNQLIDEHLPPLHQQLIRCRYQIGNPDAEERVPITVLATESGISRQNTSKHLNRAKKTLMNAVGNTKPSQDLPWILNLLEAQRQFGVSSGTYRLPSKQWIAKSLEDMGIAFNWNQAGIEVHERYERIEIELEEDRVRRGDPELRQWQHSSVGKAKDRVLAIIAACEKLAIETSAIMPDRVTIALMAGVSETNLYGSPSARVAYKRSCDLVRQHITAKQA